MTSFSHKTHWKKRVKGNANVSFLRHRQPRLHWFVACYVILLLTEIVRGLLVSHTWLDWVWVRS